MASIASIVAVIGAITQMAQTAVQIGKDAAPFIDLLRDTLGSGTKNITDAHLAEIQARVDALSQELQAPLPPEEA